MFGKIFNTIVDIAVSPVKLVAKITDDVIDSNIESYVDELKDTIKLDQ